MLARHALPLKALPTALRLRASPCASLLLRRALASGAKPPSKSDQALKSAVQKAADAVNASRARRSAHAEKDVTPKGWGAVKPHKPEFPERLLIYNAGTLKTGLIGITKIVVFLVSIYSTVIVAPALYEYPEWSITTRSIAGTAYMVLGPLPIVITAYITAPFVNSVYIRLPAWARQSAQHLKHFASSIPKDTKFEFLTVRLLGNAKTSGLQLSELRMLPKRRFRLANIERVRWQPVKHKGFFTRILSEPRNKFYVADSSGSARAERRTRAPGVWSEAKRQIEENGREMAKKAQKKELLEKASGR